LCVWLSQRQALVPSPSSQVLADQIASDALQPWCCVAIGDVVSVSGAERPLEDVGCDVGRILAGHTHCHEAEDSVYVTIENQSEPGGIAPGVLNDPTVGFDLKPHPIARLTDGRRHAIRRE